MHLGERLIDKAAARAAMQFIQYPTASPIFIYLQNPVASNNILKKQTPNKLFFLEAEISF